MFFLTTLLVVPLAVPAPTATEILPLKGLKLYETGVGYFERGGHVEAGKRTALPLPASHLDDALKTLVILSKDRRVEIGGIEFASSVSEGMARALAGLPLEAETDLRYADLLRSLEGVQVELRTGKKALRGRLVEVLGPFTQPALERDAGSPVHLLAALGATGALTMDRDDDEDDDEAPDDARAAYPVEPEYTLVIQTRAGEVRRVRTRDMSSIRPVDPGASARLEVALAALSSRAPQAERSLSVQFRGSGPLRIGYIAETPVWRTTYRVVLDDKSDDAALQAWALLHNDTDEDWRGVSVELVNGLPTSFLFPLAAPRYARRELAEPEVTLSTVPQLLNTTADRLWGDFIDGEYGSGSGSFAARGYGGLGMSGYGSGSGGMSGSVRLGAAPTTMLGDLAEYAQATGEENQALFTYRLPAAIDLAAHHSALVPVVRQTIEAEAITWFNTDNDQAFTGARLLNSTSQTLPAGTVAVFDSGGFRGESGFDRLKPGEQCFAVHGIDLDVDLERRKRYLAEEIVSVEEHEGTLSEQLINESALDVELRNRSGQARTIYLALSVARNATVSGHEPLDFDHLRHLPLARFELPAGSKLKRELRAREAGARSTAVGELTAARLQQLAKTKRLPAGSRSLLAEAAKLRAKLETERTRRGEREARAKEIEVELKRLRDNLRAVGSTGLKDGAAAELGKRVVDREDQIDALRRASDWAKGQEARLTKAIADKLAKL